MKLDPKVKQHLENVYNLKIPKPTDKDFAAFMEALSRTNPKAYHKLEQGIVLESLGDPKSFLERKAIVAERLNRLKHQLFYRFDDIQSHWFPSRTKIILLGATPVVLFMAIMYVPRWLPEFGVAAQNPAVQAFGHQMGFGPLYEVDLGATPAEIIIQEETPPQPKIITKDTIPEAAPPPLAPNFEAPLPPPALQSVTKYQRDITPSPKVFAREKTINSPDPFVQETATGLSVFQRERSEQGLAVELESENVQSLSVNTREPFMHVLSQEAAVVAASSPDPFASEPITMSEPVPPLPVAPSSSYAPGTQITAMLEVGIMTLDEQKVPVIARGDDGSIWQGEARLNHQRFEIEFSTVTHGVTQSIKAYAVASDGFVGLPVVWRETTPTLAGDLLRGSLKGVSNYVENLSKQTIVTQDEFGKTITQTLAPLEMQLLGSLSEMFQPSTEEALVRIAELPPGTHFTILLF
jgi:hypothetical protein